MLVTPGRSRTLRGKSDEFWSPRDVVTALAESNSAPYAVDLAANARNAVAPKWIGRGEARLPVHGVGDREAVETTQDGSLAFDWADAIAICDGPGWCNPPFSQPNLKLFTEKAWQAGPRLRYPLDMLVPVSPRAASRDQEGRPVGWFARVWEGEVEGYHAINFGPLRGQVLRLRCEGYLKELLFFGYSLRFLEDGRPTDAALGSHMMIRLRPS